jgi:hypothetical protein
MNLDDNNYKLAKWVQKVPNDSPYSAILETTQLNQSTLSYGKHVDTILILSYLRNVIEHYKDQVNEHYKDKRNHVTIF